MEFLGKWKQEVQKRLEAWRAQFREDSTAAVYGGLVTTALWPVIQAIQSGADAGQILGAAYSLAGAVGVNLIANLIQQRADSVFSQEAFAAQVQEQLENSDFRQGADMVLAKLDAVATTCQDMPNKIQEQFANALHQELEAYGNFEAVLGDNCQYIKGNVAGDAMAQGALKIGTVNITIHHHAPDTGGKSPIQGANLKMAYLKHLYEDAEHLSLSIFAKEEADKKQSLVALGQVYTALGTKEVESKEGRSKMPEADQLERAESRSLSAVEMANGKARLVLLGDPGSGKSTFVNHLILCLVGQCLKEKEANLEQLTRSLPGREEKEAIQWDHGQLLPIFIQLRDFAVKALPAKGQKGHACHLWKYIRLCLKDWGVEDYFESLKQQVLQSESKTILLLDGLDEVPDPKNQRKQIKEVIEDFAKGSDCRIIVTSRTYAYQKQDWELDHFHQAELAPFDEDQIRYFVDHWYQYQVITKQYDKDDAAGRAELLKNAIFKSHRHLQDLAERPLLLTLMAVLHSWHGRDLPEKRVELYEQTLQLLIHRWNSDKEALDRSGRSRLQKQDLTDWLDASKDQLRFLLERLAFEAHARQNSEEDTADVPKKDLIYGLSQIGKSMATATLEEYVKDRMGILLERGHEVFTFPHRTFQEYLAACYLTRTGFPQKITELTRKDPQRWREVAQLVGLKVNTAHSALALAQRLSGQGKSQPDHWGTLIAAEFLAESDCCKELDTVEKRQFRTLLNHLAKVLGSAFLPAIERALAGRLLSQLGDPRKEVLTCKAMEFMPVPAGSFWMGEEDGLKNNLDEFYMARYPVSQAQYRQFIQADGYKEERFWQEAIDDKRWKDGKVKVWGKWESSPRSFGDPFDMDNHPVVDVCWYEAMAFCHWLTEHLKNTKKTPADIRSLLEQDWRVTLPSEAQWEKAARGMADKRIFPWGDQEDADRANCRDTKIGATSALGCFPKGQSPSNCEDMSGNVWEWCRTLWQEDYKDYENEVQTAKKESSRVLRGGAYYRTANLVRCSARLNHNPNLRLSHIGFRVSLSPFL